MMVKYEVTEEIGYTYTTMRLEVVGQPSLWQSIKLAFGFTITLEGCKVKKIKEK